ncbi:MAG: hypothetical protein DMD58_12020 [Gemmatimonadetes bacterium]|nr:MAG: hypothetical protein DMD58_12020 [Gemmatimonadota bacterium]
MSHVTRFAIAVAAMVGTLAGCRDVARQLAPDATMSRSIDPMMSQMTEESSAPLVQHVIAPQATDPAIDRALADHYVWLDTAARGNPKLLVFMPGNNNTPSGWLKFEQVAARQGYHVIGLMYQNEITVVNVCRGSPDPDCSGNIHLEVQDGIDRSSLVNVTPANGIENRLTKLLLYLDAQYPDEGWSRFLEDGAPKWSQIAVSGQSQGSAQAALIGKLHHVDRVVMFSGPPDARVPEEVDRWISIGATPAAKYFALFHDRDHLVVGIRANLTALIGQFGDPVIAELNDPPYGGTHIVYTDLRPTLGYDAFNAPHQSTARDNNTPIGPDGVPLLRDAWRYLLGEEPRGGSEKTITLTAP